MFAEDAAGWHADETRLERACRRKREEGRADAWIAARHPELRTAMPMSRAATPRQRLSRWLAFSCPWLGDIGASVLASTLPALDRIGATMAWLRVLYAVFGYWYERGLADALGDRDALRRLLRDAWQEPRLLNPGIAIDLADGLGVAAARLDAERPEAATLWVGERLLGHVPWVPGSERLSGPHLMRLLAEQYHERVVTLLLADGALTLDALMSPQAADAARPEARQPAAGLSAR